MYGFELPLNAEAPKDTTVPAVEPVTKSPPVALITPLLDKERFCEVPAANKPDNRFNVGTVVFPESVTTTPDAASILRFPVVVSVVGKALPVT